MEKRIFDIGRTKYRINVDIFADLLGEVNGGGPDQKKPASAGAEPGPTDAATAKAVDRAEVQGVFDEVMQLYREYARTGSMDLLVSLKCLLEEVSLRYSSVPLAEEVLHINSCLPYERRVPCNSCGGKLKELR